MVERFTPGARRLNEDLEIVARLPLTGEIVESQRAQRLLGRIAGDVGGVHEPCSAVGHALSSLRPARTSDSRLAAAPSACIAWATAE